MKDQFDDGPERDNSLNETSTTSLGANLSSLAIPMGVDKAIYSCSEASRKV